MLTVNCFSPTFGRMPSSVAHQIPTHIQYVWEQMYFDGITIFTDGLVNDSALVKRVQSPIKIGWLREPRCLYPNVYEESINHIDDFSFILTYDKGLIEAYPRYYRYLPYGGTWIDKKDWRIFPKTKNVSMLFGEKRATNGHRLRHEIFEKLGYRYGIDYYGKYGTPTNYGQDTKMMVLKDYRFSIVIETCMENGLFTEILLDALAVGTIPIFWGAPDIGDYLDDDGILRFSTVDGLETILRFLEGKYESVYDELLSRAEFNLYTMKVFAITEDYLYGQYLKYLSA